MQVDSEAHCAYLIYFHKYLLDHHKEKKFFLFGAIFRKSYLIHSQNHLFLLRAYWFFNFTFKFFFQRLLNNWITNKKPVEKN